MMDTLQKDTTEMLKLPLRCELNFLSKPDGSVVFSQGETVVVAGVYGPGDVKRQRIQGDKASVETVFAPKAGQSMVGDRQREAFIRNTCETAILCALYPRTGVSITVQEIQDYGGLLACCVNAACLALLNSGIEMRFQFAAVLCIVDQEDNVIVDPDYKQIKDSKVRMTFVFESTSYKVVACHTEGIFSQLQYQEGLLNCKQASQELFNYYRSTIQRYVVKL